MLNKFIRILFIVLSCCLISCGNKPNNIISEKEEKHYQRANRLYREGRFQEAMSAYLKVIDKRRDAPESHLEVGRLYLEHISDPIAAIYHFRKFLEYKPDVEQSPMVRQMIETGKKEFAKTLPGSSFDNDIERIDLMDLVKQLRDENVDLKNKIAGIKRHYRRQDYTQPQQQKRSVARKPRNSQQTPSFVQKPKESIIPQVSLYTVTEGDTLSRISQKVYGTTKHWEKIFQNNRELLNSPNELKVGQVLKIPSTVDS